MPRGKRIIITKNPFDNVVLKLKNFNIEQLKQKRKQQESELYSNVSKMVKEANKLVEQEKLDKARLRSMGFLSIDEAYEEVKRAGIGLSYRAFGGRIERESLRSEKIGKKRVIAKPILNDWISLHSNFYSIKKAYGLLKQHEKDLNLRAFIGRIEKNSIPSIKINTQRLIPKEVVESLTHIAKNYVDVSQAIALLQQNNIKIKRNAFERRLDRGRIPHIKIGGRRLISKVVIDELIKKELELQQKRSKSLVSTPESLKPPFNPSQAIPKPP